MKLSPLDYPVTKPVHLPWKNNLLLAVLFVIYAVITTLLNVAAVAYEAVPITTTSFNTSHTLWYERLVPVGSS